jgi:hypothetical protein
LCPHLKRELEVTSPSGLPIHVGVMTLLKYRTLADYRRVTFVGPRLADVVVFAALVASLYAGLDWSVYTTADNDAMALTLMGFWGTTSTCAPCSQHTSGHVC